MNFFKKADTIVLLVFSIVGIAFLVAGMVSFSFINNFKENAIEHTAIITDIHRNRGADSDETTVYVEYFVEGKKYEQQLDFYSSGMSVGDEVKIYYNPDNPNKIQSDSTIIFSIMFLGMGGLFFSIAFILVLGKVKEKANKRRMLETGRVIYADISEVVLNLRYHVNDKHPYVIHCKWYDNVTGVEYLFKSGNIWGDPNQIIEQKQLTKLPVYVDLNNPKKYYMDLKESFDV